MASIKIDFFLSPEEGSPVSKSLALDCGCEKKTVSLLCSDSKRRDLLKFVDVRSFELFHRTADMNKYRYKAFYREGLGKVIPWFSTLAPNSHYRTQRSRARIIKDPDDDP